MLTKFPFLTVNLNGLQNETNKGPNKTVVALWLKIQAMWVKFSEPEHQEQPKITIFATPQSFSAGHLPFNCSKGSVLVTSSQSRWIRESTKQQMSLDCSIADRCATDF